MKVVTDNNEILDATVSIGKFKNLFGLIFESRGGAMNTNFARNTDYSKALETIIYRLKNSRITSIKVYLVSNAGYLKTTVDRLLKVDSSEEINLSNYDAHLLNSKLGVSMSENRKNHESIGGNPTKRILIESDLSEGEWLNIINNSNSYPVNDESDLENIKVEFDPQNIDESIEKTLREITQRRGQYKFRNKLIKIYNGKCAMTGTHVLQVLQAAHIFPYKGTDTNHITNGILLRSDIHDLFDLLLIGIDEDYKIVVSHDLDGTEYENLNGKIISLSANPEEYPSKESLKMRPLPYRK